MMLGSDIGMSSVGGWEVPVARISRSGRRSLNVRPLTRTKAAFVEDAQAWVQHLNQELRTTSICCTHRYWMRVDFRMRFAGTYKV